MSDTVHQHQMQSQWQPPAQQQQQQQQQIDIGELKIPTSFGHLSAKTWGIDEPNRLHILAVHGWSDNAGTFDRLIPLLPLKKLYVVAIDLPGHGSSCHLPPGSIYTDLIWAIYLKHTLDHLEWKHNVTIMAHSMGACASLELSVLFPEMVSNLIMFDSIKPRVFPSERISLEMATNIETICHAQMNRFSTRSTMYFDMERAIDLIIETHTNGRLDRRSARCLMERAVETNRDGRFRFKRDARLNYPINRKMNADRMLTYLSNIRCRLMIIRARGRHHTLRCEHDTQFIQMYHKSCDDFQFIEVDGDHYVHLTQPENVVEHVCQFIRPLLDQLD
ncbi:hypothetical protein RDWZM_009905 [Blomia tropicalis]|uniref:AB hydrolase-1 domain-containing protein n=1 Tax=Blomia tropicalis TaxID=40697 RepID=A0A9Q0M0P5_BLOTA|nr:hypothetical protein RDWZM_009905 [Blomia tropicalis]